MATSSVWRKGAAYRKSGRFPDGSVLAKEVFEATTGAMTTGTVSHAQTLTGWFVLVKDSKNSHPGNKLWGNGWGWSWFDAANPSKTTSTDYKPDCLPCHEPARASDGIYVQGYPALSNDYQACQGKPPSETFRLETKGTHVA
jgi:hypothetical protein